MFNNYSSSNSNSNNTNIKVNAVCGTLVKNYQKSFFFKCQADGEESRKLFSPIRPRIQVSEYYKYDTNEKETEYKCGRYVTKECYYRDIVVIQIMILADGMLLSEVMWKDEFDEMFVIPPVEQEV